MSDTSTGKQSDSPASVLLQKNMSSLSDTLALTRHKYTFSLKTHKHATVFRMNGHNDSRDVPSVSARHKIITDTHHHTPKTQTQSQTHSVRLSHSDSASCLFGTSASARPRRCSSGRLVSIFPLSLGTPAAPNQHPYAASCAVMDFQSEDTSPFLPLQCIPSRFFQD